MPGLDPGIHEAARRAQTLRNIVVPGTASWIAGSSPAMTAAGDEPLFHFRAFC
jgi:hypothetical protein